VGLVAYLRYLLVFRTDFTQGGFTKKTPLVPPYIPIYRLLANVCRYRISSPSSGQVCVFDAQREQAAGDEKGDGEKGEGFICQ
jgi:hypothetical protein